jgi:hypothetical protein
LIAAEVKNKIITNSESVGADEWDFPAIAEGWNFIFIIEAAQNVTLDPNGTDQWYLNGTQMAAGEAIVNTAPQWASRLPVLVPKPPYFAKVNIPTLQRKAHEALNRYSIRAAFCYSGLGDMPARFTNCRRRKRRGARRLQRYNGTTTYTAGIAAVGASYRCYINKVTIDCSETRARFVLA